MAVWKRSESKARKKCKLFLNGIYVYMHSTNIVISSVYWKKNKTVESFDLELKQEKKINKVHLSTQIYHAIDKKCSFFPVPIKWNNFALDGIHKKRETLLARHMPKTAV